jgi:DNA polymerase III delta subunit
LFSPRELAIVLDVEDLGRSEKTILALAEGVMRPSGGTCLVLLESAADGDRKVLAPLRTACSRWWSAETPSREELLRWSARRLARDGVRAEAGVIESVADQCENDPSALFNELDKLATFAGPDGRLTDDDVRRLRRPALDADLPEYLAAVALGDVAGASRRLGRLLATGAGEGEVLWALSNLVGGALGGWKKVPQPSFALARRCATRDLGRALDALYRAEAAWKGGRTDVTVLLEHATRLVAAGDWSTSSGSSRSSRT